jgi:hypothetical protein
MIVVIWSSVPRSSPANIIQLRSGRNPRKYSSSPSRPISKAKCSRIALAEPTIDSGLVGKKEFGRGNECLLVGIFISNPASEVDHFGSEGIAGSGVHGKDQ